MNFRMSRKEPCEIKIIFFFHFDILWWMKIWREKNGFLLHLCDHILLKYLHTSVHVIQRSLWFSHTGNYICLNRIELQMLNFRFLFLNVKDHKYLIEFVCLYKMFMVHHYKMRAKQMCVLIKPTFDFFVGFFSFLHNVVG